LSERILLADDEPDLLATVSYALEQAGFTVDAVADGEAALAACRSASYDLVVLDVVMPRMSGTDVCRKLREDSIVPIIMLTAKDTELDRVVGLEIGADDYITKPFSVTELVSRVRAIMRRREFDRSANGERERTIGGLSIDFTTHEVRVEGSPVALTPSEFKLLAYLAQEPGRVFSRRQIMEHLWDSPFVGDQRACDAHVSNLRHKIERDARHPERILTVREIGYKLVAA
jgi:DNA-binding response OmpR family regulator